MNGAQLETFILKFSKYFFWQKFKEVCHEVYFSKPRTCTSSTAILIGIKSFNAASQHGIILINPYNYLIQPGDYAVVIANNIEEALLVQNYEEIISLKQTETMHKRPLVEQSKECNY